MGALASLPLAAQQPYVPKQSDRPEPLTGDEPGFQPIFDGKALNGWEGDPKYWRVAEGVMTGEITPETIIKSNTFIICLLQADLCGERAARWRRCGTARAPAVAKGGVAVATVLIVPGDDAVVDAVRSLQDQFDGEVGASAWNGIAAVRLCAPDGAALRHDLVHVMTAVRGDAAAHLDQLTERAMNLTPREKDKLLISVAAMVARRRLERGVKLNTRNRSR